KKVHPRYKRKIDVVYNGYDEDYLKANIFGNKNDDYCKISDSVFNIVSFGKLSYYSKEYSKIFFNALKRFEENHPSIRVIQIGREEPETIEVLKSTGFNKSNY